MRLKGNTREGIMIVVKLRADTFWAIQTMSQTARGERDDDNAPSESESFPRRRWRRSPTDSKQSKYNRLLCSSSRTQRYATGTSAARAADGPVWPRGERRRGRPRLLRHGSAVRSGRKTRPLLHIGARPRTEG